MVTRASGVLAPSRGVGHWLRSYAVMTRWHFASLRLWAVTAAAIEVLSGTGMVLGIGLLAPHLSTAGKLYATTGPAAAALLLIGTIFGPQLVAQQRLDGSYHYLLTLAVPRSAAAFAWYTVTLSIGVPAAVLTVLAGLLRFGISLSPSAALIPAVLLGVFTTTMLGYALAHAVSRPMVTIIVAELFIFIVFGYAPINFPANQMPAWLVDVNRGLPYLPMATAVRAALTRGLSSDLAASYAALGAWSVASMSLAMTALRHRP